MSWVLGLGLAPFALRGRQHKEAHHGGALMDILATMLIDMCFNRPLRREIVTCAAGRAEGGQATLALALNCCIARGW